MSDVSRPEDIHHVPGPVHPVVEEVIQEQGEDPGEWACSGPFKGAIACFNQGIHHRAKHCAGGIDELA